ncbi:MAG: hypothetical protein H7146_13885, partial [Burkholderiaceae bacterium]|nr:hypothetical protein [Microbacteriaceae bacterium]
LGALTGMPVLAGDNSYGKVSAIYADYLHGFENVAMVSSLEEARERLGVLLG